MCQHYLWQGTCVRNPLYVSFSLKVICHISHFLLVPFLFPVRKKIRSTDCFLFVCSMVQPRVVHSVSSQPVVQCASRSNMPIETSCKKFRCAHPECKYSADKQSDVTDHHQSAHQGMFWVCSDCQKPYKSKKWVNFIKGILTYGTWCVDVHRCFTFCRALKRHEQNHTGKMPFICHRCGIGFCQKSRLQQHGVAKHGDEPLKCSSCDKVVRYDDMKKHQKNCDGRVSETKFKKSLFSIIECSACVLIRETIVISFSFIIACSICVLM